MQSGHTVVCNDPAMIFDTYTCIRDTFCSRNRGWFICLCDWHVLARARSLFYCQSSLLVTSAITPMASQVVEAVYSHRMEIQNWRVKFLNA